MERQAEQERNDREYADYKRGEALKSLQRAEQWGDQWGRERALRELRDL